MTKKLLFFSLLAVVCFGAAAYFFIVKQPAGSVKAGNAVAPVSSSKIVDASSAPKPASIPKPPDDRSSRQAIDEIRSELQSVMLLNEKIKEVQTSKSAQLLKIQEQAVIHQRILANIEQMNSAEVKTMPSREALLAQEKLRIIREETLRNKKILEKVSSKTTA